MNHLLRQVVIGYCPAWAWGDIIVKATSYNNNIYDIEHRVSMIPAPPDGILDIHERNNTKASLPIAIDSIIITHIEPGVELHITATAKYSSEVDGDHAKYSQHQCWFEDELHIDTDAVGQTAESIKCIAKNIIQAYIDCIFEKLLREVNMDIQEFDLYEKEVVFARYICSKINSEGDDKEVCFVYQNKLVFIVECHNERRRQFENTMGKIQQDIDNII
jgi:hypothetical protein